MVATWKKINRKQKISKIKIKNRIFPKMESYQNEKQKWKVTKMKNIPKICSPTAPFADASELETPSENHDHWIRRRAVLHLQLSLASCLQGIKRISASILLHIIGLIGHLMQVHVRFLTRWRREREEREPGSCFAR